MMGTLHGNNADHQITSEDIDPPSDAEWDFEYEDSDSEESEAAAANPSVERCPHGTTQCKQHAEAPAIKLSTNRGEASAQLP